MHNLALGILPNPEIEDTLTRLETAVRKSASLCTGKATHHSPMAMYVAREGLERFSMDVLVERIENVVLHYALPTLRFRHRLAVSPYNGTIYWDIQNPKACDSLMSAVAGKKAPDEPTRYGYVVGQLRDVADIKNVEDIFLNQESLEPVGLVLGRIGAACEFTEVVKQFKISEPVLT